MTERGTLVRTSHGVYRVPLIPAGPLDQYISPLVAARRPSMAHTRRASTCV
jgi:predicted transcriptional regulator of viral defense system